SNERLRHAAAAQERYRDLATRAAQRVDSQGTGSNMAYRFEPLRLGQVEVAEGGRTTEGFGEVCSGEHRPAQVGLAQVRLAEVHFNESGAAQVGLAEAGLGQVGPAQVGAAQN